MGIGHKIRETIWGKTSSSLSDCGQGIGTVCEYRRRFRRGGEGDTYVSRLEQPKGTCLKSSKDSSMTGHTRTGLGICCWSREQLLSLDDCCCW